MNKYQKELHRIAKGIYENMVIVDHNYKYKYAKEMAKYCLWCRERESHE